MSTNGLSSGVCDEDSTPLSSGIKIVAENEKEIKMCKKKENSILRYFYILSWIKTYDRSKAIADLIAGVTLGMTIIPQSIAYASLAGLSTEFGLYSSFMGSFVYIIFGTIPQVSIGPTSLMALLTLKFTNGLPNEFAVILAFISGVMELAMGILDLGFIVRFISHPVSSAFTTGTSVIIIASQFKKLIGMNVKNYEIDSLDDVWKASPGDCILGPICVLILLSLRQMNTIKFAVDNTPRKFLKKFLWYISISRNATVVLFSSLLAYYLSLSDNKFGIRFTLSKKVNSTMLTMHLPPFTIDHENTQYSFIRICYILGSGIFIVPIVAVLANVAIAKAFVKDSLLNASQEMLTLGVCNIAGSFFNAMPTCGAFTRSAVSNASGVRTPLSGLYTGGLVILALGTLTPYFEYIPESSLAAVLICAVLFMIDFKTITELWKKSKADFCNWIGVFTICIVFGVELGLLFGILFNFAFVATRLANPRIEATVKNLSGVTFVHFEPSTDVYFAGADELRSRIKSFCYQTNYKYPVVIDCKTLTMYDFTLLKAVKSILRELEERNVQVFLQNLSLETMKELGAPESSVIFFSNENDLENFFLKAI